MARANPGLGAIQFGVFEVDLRSGELRKRGLKVKLQEQPFQILCALLEQPGEVVSREELRTRIWPADTFLDFDVGLNNAVKRLREALGDSAEAPRYVETLPKRGYRFIGSLNGHTQGTIPKANGLSKQTQSSPSTDSRTLGLRLTVAAGALLLVVLLVGFNWEHLRKRLAPKSGAPNIHSLAVLPLQNLSGDPSQEYFADGMTEELITELSHLSALEVISRTSVMRYKKSDKSLPVIARELGVDAVVEGSVIRAGERVRITAQLIYAPKDTNLWAETYDRDLRDVLSLQSAIAQSIAHEIKIKTTPQQRARFESHHSVNVKALDAYLQGEYHLNRYGRGFGEDEDNAAIASFQRAIQEDPAFARAYVQMGSAYEGLMRPPDQRMPLERAAAEKALELDPDLAEAHFTMGRVKFFYEWDFPAAELEFKRAIELNPSNAEAHAWFSGYLRSIGRWDQAREEAATAQRLDPMHILHFVYDYPGGEDRGIPVLRSYLELNPDDGNVHLELADLYARKGMQKEHVGELQKSAILFGLPRFAQELSDAYTRSGYRGALQAWALGLDKNNVHRPLMAAQAYARLGDRERAFNWLERAYRQHEDDMVFLNSDPAWEPLRSDPRFKDLVRRVGLPAQSPRSASLTGM